MIISLVPILVVTFGITKEITSQQWTANHNFALGEVAVYPTASFVTTFGPVTLLYTAGTSITFQTASTVTFPVTTTVFGQNGAEAFAANAVQNFPNGKIMIVPPGTTMHHTTPTVIRYGGIFGSPITFVTYVTAATVFFNSPSQPSVFPAGTNSINYYNPGGGTTIGGPSPPPLNFLTTGTYTIETRVTGYTVEGYPIREYKNVGTGEIYLVTQFGQNSARVTRTTSATPPRSFLP